MLPVDYRLDTSIGDDLSLAGDAHLHLKAAHDGDRVFGVELSRLLNVESVTLEGGAPLVYFHNEDLSREELELRGNDLVYIVLSQPMKLGEELRLEIRYHGSVIGDCWEWSLFRRRPRKLVSPCSGLRAFHAVRHDLSLAATPDTGRYGHAERSARGWRPTQRTLDEFVADRHCRIQSR